MRCINPNCGKELEAEDKFCIYCGTQQSLREKTTTQLSQTPVVASAPPQEQVAAVSPAKEARGEVLVMRPGEGIWHFTELLEGEAGRLLGIKVKPGQRRPLVITDEESVHLARTDRRLDPEELLQRVRFILEAQEVPVEVQLVRARWLSDSQEVRPRLVASLKNHPYSDIKMIMGVDYIGRWASIHLLLGIEPEPEPKWKMPTDAIAALILGGIMLIAGIALNSRAIGSVGFLSLAYGGLRAFISNRTQALARKAKKLGKVVERLSRTFKVDDMRLFCTAMRQVFQVVVDDIVQRGAEVVRIEGGRGGYFQAMGVERPAPTPHRTDAAQAEV